MTPRKVAACGTVSGYRRHRNRGEQACQACLAASSRQSRRYQLNRELGRTNSYVDAGPARGHIEKLLALGMSANAIDLAAQVSEGTSTLISRGRGSRPRRKRISRNTERAILSVPLRPGPRQLARLSSGSDIDSLGTLRRLQALACLGYTRPRLAIETGLSETGLKKVKAGMKVQASTAAAVAAAYERLSMTPWVPEGEAARRQAHRVRTAALAAGYIPPLGWEEGQIDDPAARPAPRYGKPG